MILDNFSYYVLRQIYTNKDGFVRECNRLLHFLDKIAADRSMTVYFVDTPLNQGLILEESELKMIRQIFYKILHHAEYIERFYKGGAVERLTIEEGKKYMFC